MCGFLFLNILVDPTDVKIQLDCFLFYSFENVVSWLNILTDMIFSTSESVL